MWARAFTILFELRARVSQNLKTTIDINNQLGIVATIDGQATIEDLRKAQETLGMGSNRNDDIPDPFKSKGNHYSPEHKYQSSKSMKYSQKLREQNLIKEIGQKRINKAFTQNMGDVSLD